jgi:hypothetical protein
MINLPVRWMLERLFVADMQQQKAAARRLLRAGQRQRYAY